MTLSMMGNVILRKPTGNRPGLLSRCWRWTDRTHALGLWTGRTCHGRFHNNNELIIRADLFCLSWLSPLSSHMSPLSTWQSSWCECGGLRETESFINISQIETGSGLSHSGALPVTMVTVRCPQVYRRFRSMKTVCAANDFSVMVSQLSEDDAKRAVFPET